MRDRPHAFGVTELRDALAPEDHDDDRTLPELAVDLLGLVEMSDAFDAEQTHDAVDEPHPDNFTIFCDVGVPNAFRRASSAAPEMWVYAVDDGLAAGSARSEVVLDKAGRYLPYVTRAPFIAPLFDDIEVEHLPGTALMVRTPGAMMFSHWLYDLLPRVEAARAAGYGPDTVDYVLVNGGERPYEFESLEAMGYRRDQILHVHGNTRSIQADRLVVPTYPRAVDQSKYTPPWARRLVRSTFGIHGDPKDRPKRAKVAYLSRQSAHRRKIVPHDQLDTFLGSVDAVWIEPEHLTVRETAQQLHDVALLVGPHGAGLANGVFLPPWSAAMEIIGSQFMLEHFHVLTSSTSHYVGVSANDEGDDVFSSAAMARVDARTNTENQELDIVLDPERTAQALDWAQQFLDDY
ncbi:MAG: glycosyltransferase family 61 protein [Acidimicrobiales bacterium]